MFAVLPFGNRTVIETLTGAQLDAGVRERLHAGVRSRTSPAAPAGSRRSPGLKVTYHCNGQRRSSTAMWKTPGGIGGPATLVGPTDTVRFVTNDFMYTGGDGYTVFAQGTDVLQPGDALLDVAVEYIGAHSPVAPVVEGRITVTP